MRPWTISIALILGFGAAGAAPPRPQDDVAAIVKKLGSADENVRLAAVRKLYSMGSSAKAAAPVLARVLAGNDPRLRGTAAMALGRMGETGVPLLAGALSHPDPAVRRYAAIGLRYAGEAAKPAVPSLIQVLRDPDTYTARYAAETLAKLEKNADAAVPALSALLEDPARSPWAAGAIVRIRPGTKLADDCVRRLAAMLENADTRLRYEAAGALIWAGKEAKAALPALIKALKDPLQTVRYQAARAIGTLGPDAKPAVKALMLAVNDAHPSVRTYAIHALGQIGPGASEAVPVLKRLAEGGDARRASSARSALSRIDPTLKIETPAPGTAATAAAKEPPPERQLPALLTGISKDLTRGVAGRSRQYVVLVLDDSMGSALETDFWTAWNAALEDHPLRKKGQLYLGIVVLSEKSYVALQPTNKIDRVGAVVKKIAEKPNNYYKNTIAAVQLAASVLRSKPGTRAVVLYSQDNADGENQVEQTLALLMAGRTKLYAITPEAVYSDHYWKSYGYSGKKTTIVDPRTRKPVQLEFAIRGEEAPFIEFPFRWMFTAINGMWIPEFGLWDGNSPLLVPSGFTFYAPARLAKETGGKIQLCPPSKPIPPFCVFVLCPVCGGGHEECDPGYNDTKLDITSPPLEARGDYMRRKNVDPLQAMTIRVWWEAFKLGMVSAEPPVRISNDNRLELNDAVGTTRRYVRSLVPWAFSEDAGSVNWKGRARNAEKQASEVADLVARMGGELEKVDLLAANKRWLATAETIHAYLRVCRMNLLQWQHFCLEQATKDFGVGRVTMTAMPRYSFCHGGKAVEDQDIYGAEALREDWKSLCAGLDGVIDRHRGTPWELLVRRAMILNWGVTVVRPGTGTARTNRARPSRSSKKSATETGGNSGPPTRAGRSSRGSSSSRTGTSSGNPR